MEEIAAARRIRGGCRPAGLGIPKLERKREGAGSSRADSMN